MQNSKMKPSRKLNRLAAGLLIGLWALTPGWVHALPTGGEIVHGSGKIEVLSPPVDVLVQPDLQVPTAELLVAPLPTDMVVYQESQQLITNWQSFSIGALESVTFKQPDSSAVALNRVTGIDPSIILGKLSGNGQVFLSNPSGVVFGPGSKVDVHGLLATTLGISNDDFLKGNYTFSQDPNRPLAAILNSGDIRATDYIGLAAPGVVNTGSIIVADLGSVALASGTAATLDFNGDGLVSFKVTGEVSGLVTDVYKNVVGDRINNSGLIQANGGQVFLTARSAGDVIGSVVNHSGVIQAQTVEEKAGKIYLSGTGRGDIQLSGTLDASKVLVTADSDRNGTGSVTVAAGETLTTNNNDIEIIADDLMVKGQLNSGTGDVTFTVANGSRLILSPGGSNGGHLSGEDIGHIIAQNLILNSSANINVKGITEENTSGITDFVYLNSGKNINFDEAASTFPSVKVSAVNDINVNVDVATTKGDFIAMADSDVDGFGDFNVLTGAVVTAARDIIINAVTINAVDQSLQETRDLILNGNVVEESALALDTNSIQQGSLSSFLTEFFENAGSGGC